MEVKCRLKKADEGLKMFEFAQDLNLNKTRSNVQFLLNSSDPNDVQLISDLNRARRTLKMSRLKVLGVGTVVYVLLLLMVFVGYEMSVAL